MLKTTYAFVMALAVLAFAANAQAGCGSCSADKGAKETSAEKCCGSEKCALANASAEKCCGSEKCTSETCSATACESGKGCPIAAAMGRLPKMTFAVGKEKTGCPTTAAKLAEKAGGHIHFCVADKEFDSKAEAFAALIETTEQFVADFAEPKKCSKSGNLTLAGEAQSCEKTAAHTAELMKDAMAKVKFTYLVGEKECGCPVEAGKLAKDSGKEKLFVVGEEKTGCEKTARLNLARAKYKAAVQAMLQAASTADKQASVEGA